MHTKTLVFKNKFIKNIFYLNFKWCYYHLGGNAMFVKRCPNT